MQRNTTENYFSLRNLTEPNPILRRTSLSGFNDPEQLTLNNIYFPSIPETKYSSAFPSNMYNIMNGYHPKKSEIASQNFFSENNVNLMSRNQQTNIYYNTLEQRHFYNEEPPIARFSSTPYIAQTTAEYINTQPNYQEVKSGHRQLFNNNAPIIFTNRQCNNNSQIYTNGDSYPYSHYALYNLNTNSYQNVLYYSQNTPLINSEQKIKEDIYPYQTCDLDILVNLSIEKESKLDCQLNIAQQRSEANKFGEFAEEDLIYFLQSNSSNEVTDNNRAESQSMPSLHGDDSVQSDFDNSDDDKLHTVHGEQMLHELQKLSSIFTNVVNLSKSVNSGQIGSSQSNSSRFKKTRIKERTTVWRLEELLVKDNLVKIIPYEVLHMERKDLEVFEKLENEIFGCQISKKKTERLSPDRLDCIHSKYLRHSSKTNHKYKPSFNAHSPIDLNHSINQQIPCNKSSRQSHRKSLQIPRRNTVVCNSRIPILSPTVPQHNHMLFEQFNNSSNKNSRTKRRWSVCGTKLENKFGTHNLRPNNFRHDEDFFHPAKHDVTNAHFDDRMSFDLHELSEGSPDGNYYISSCFESKLDKKLASIKETLMSYVECNLSEIKNELLSLKDTQISLKMEAKYYKDKVKILEESIRKNLPSEQWKLFGINNGK